MYLFRVSNAELMTTNSSMTSLDPAGSELPRKKSRVSFVMTTDDNVGSIAWVGIAHVGVARAGIAHVGIAHVGVARAGVARVGLHRWALTFPSSLPLTE